MHQVELRWFGCVWGVGGGGGGGKIGDSKSGIIRFGAHLHVSGTVSDAPITEEHRDVYKYNSE